MKFLNKLSYALMLTAALSLSGVSGASAKKFKIAVGDSGGSSQEATGIGFVKALEELSGGKHTAKLFLNGQLGSEQDTVNEAAIGTLDMSLLAINNITPFSPSVGVFTLPYVILSLEDAEKLTQGPIGQQLTQNTINDAGVRIIAWTYTGFRVLTNSKKPVKSVADLKGLVIRVPKNEIMIDTYKSWGISPTPMAWSETFAGLQTKVVDGQDNPYTTINAMKFYEVQKYVTNIRYIFSIEPLIISEQIFQGLSGGDQEIILKAGKAATAASAKFLRDKEAEIKQILLDKGMEISDPENDEAEFIELATKAVWPKYYKSIGGIDKLNAVLAEIGRDPVSE